MTTTAQDAPTIYQPKAVYCRKKPVLLRALQLRWDTWSEMCDFVENPSARGCFVTEDDKATHIPTDVIGLLFPGGFAVQGDFIVKHPDGHLQVVKPEAFLAGYETATVLTAAETPAGADAMPIVSAVGEVQK